MRRREKPPIKIRTIETSWSKPAEGIVLVPYTVGGVQTLKAMPTRRKK